MSHLRVYYIDSNLADLVADMEFQLGPDGSQYWRRFVHYQNTVFDINYQSAISAFVIRLGGLSAPGMWLYKVSEIRLKFIFDNMLVESVHES